MATAETLPAPEMALRSDLSRLIEGQFDDSGIKYDRSMPLDRLAARFFEMNQRWIQPVPRRVHFSDRIHAWLGKLMRRGRGDSAALDAWFTVFRLHRLLVEGANVNAFLSTGIGREKARDRLLWHYGMHHLHLCSETRADGFVKRSDHLLFAIVAPEDAYFVDVRPHPPPRSIEWSSQELLRIVHANWPELIEANVLHGILGTEVMDGEIHELRQKNVNSAVQIDGKTIAPPGGGMAGDGSSMLCTLFASRLLWEVRRHEEVLDDEEVRRAVARNLRAQGFDVGPILEFGLVFLKHLSPTPEQFDALTAEKCFSSDLFRMGLAIIEKRTGSPIVLQVTSPA